MTEIETPEECLSSEITCRKYQRIYWEENEENMIYYIDYTYFKKLGLHDVFRVQWLLVVVDRCG